jgi:hypothetical protein
MGKFISLVSLFFLVSCTSGPTENQIQTAIAMTQASNPTETFTQTLPPTATSTETTTPTAVPTETSTPTLTPTPDLRIIKVDPQKFLLKKDDLPLEGKYYIPNSSWMSIHTNEEVISGWTVEEGRNYVIKTGREIGWWVAFLRGTRAVAMPEQIFCQAVRYKTVEGAMLTITELSSNKNEKSENLKNLEIEMNLGDHNEVYLYKEITSGGDYYVHYSIEFVYRNYFASVEGFGLEKDVSHDFLEQLARKVLEKLEAAELEL